MSNFARIRRLEAELNEAIQYLRSLEEIDDIPEGALEEAEFTVSELTDKLTEAELSLLLESQITGW